MNDLKVLPVQEVSVVVLFPERTIARNPWLGEDRSARRACRLPLPRPMQLIPLLLVVVLFVFMNRQQRKRSQTQQTLLASLQPGETVVTTSGLYGTVHTTDAETVSLEIADDVVVRFAKGAIARKTQGLVPEVPQ